MPIRGRTAIELAAILSKSKRVGNGYMAICPCHDDDTPSFSFSDSPDGVLFWCFGGCPADRVFNKLRGLGFIDAKADAKYFRDHKKLIVRKSSGLATITRRKTKSYEYIYNNDKDSPVRKVVRAEFDDGSKTFYQMKKVGDDWVPGGGDEEIAPYKYSIWSGNTNPVVIVEGEKKCELAREKGIEATCVPGGSKNWKGNYSKFFNGRDVIIVPDNDAPGRSFANDVFSDLQSKAWSIKIVELPGLQEKEDIEQWFSKYNKTTQEFFECVQKASDASQTVQTWDNNPPGIIRLSEVEQKEVTFLWNPYIPKNKITILAGDPGVGKSSITLDIVSAVTKGRTIYGEPPPDQGCVLLLSAEDDSAEVLKPRLSRCDADQTKILVMQDHMDFNEQGLADLESLVERYKPKLVVIDPIQAYISNTDMNRANEVRIVMASLSRIATDNDITILIVMHMNKGSMKAQYRLIGSIDFLASSRSVILAGKVEKEPSRRGIQIRQLSS